MIKCKDCRFFVRKDEESGQCRRKSPHFLDPGWPLIYDDNCCGEGEIEKGYKVKSPYDGEMHEILYHTDDYNYKPSESWIMRLLKWEFEDKKK